MLPRPSLLLPCLLAWLLAGCGDDGGPGPGDAAAADGGDAFPPEPTSPDLPRLTPCPTGWAERISADGDPSCEPYDGDPVSDCAAGEARLPGSTACAPLGPPCPAGDFAEDLPADRPIVYALAGAPGGDGSATAPFGTVRDALSAASSGTVVALGRGRFDEVVTLRAGITLRGACIAETVLTSSAASTTAGVVNVPGPGSSLRNLGIEDGSRPGIVVGEGGELLVDAVSVDRATESGVQVLGGTLTGEGLRVGDTNAGPDGRFGRGLDVEGRGTATLSRVELLRNRDMGAFVGEEGSFLSLSEFSVRDTDVELATGENGWGVMAVSRGAAELHRGVVEGSREGGVFATLEGRIEGSELVMRDNRGRVDGQFGCGFAVQQGGRLELSRSVVERVLHLGGLVSSGGSALLEDLIVRDVAPRISDDLGGRGITVQSGSNAELRRVLLSGNRATGLTAGEPTTVVRAEDLVVRATAAESATLDMGFGLFARVGGDLEVSRARVEGSHDVGVFSWGEGARVRLEDAVVDGTRSRELDGRYGRGVDAARGGGVELSRVRVVDSRDVGVFVGAAGSTVTGRDVAVLDVLPQACTADGCVDRAFGVGLGAYDAGVMDVERFRVARSALCGVQVARGGQLDLRTGVVEENLIGACLLEDYDVDRLTTEVRYRDNETNLDTTGGLPVPDPLPPIDEPTP